MGDPINADIWNGLNTVPVGKEYTVDFNVNSASSP